MKFTDLLQETSGSDRLARDVRFRSPYADYAGREVASHLFGLIDEVLSKIEMARRLADDDAAVSVFSAKAGGAPVDGTLLTVVDRDGEIAEAMLTLRPVAGVKVALAAMSSLLEARPLPRTRPNAGGAAGR